MKPLAAILLTLCLTAQADPSQRAQEAAVADVATTVLSLSLGAAEANPIGLATIPLKWGILEYAGCLPDGEKQTVQSAVGSFWLGAAANNIRVIFSILSGGTFAPLCAAAVQDHHAGQGRQGGRDHRAGDAGGGARSGRKGEDQHDQGEDHRSVCVD